jgi:hypothetical protein
MEFLPAGLTSNDFHGHLQIFNAARLISWLPLPEKYPALPIGKNIFRTPAVHPTKGRVAIVTDAGLDAMDASSINRRIRNKPLKPLGRKRRESSANLWRLRSCASFICTRGRGCGAHPAFPAPSVTKGIHAQLGRDRAARTRTFVRVVIASLALASTKSGRIGCLKFKPKNAPPVIIRESESG